jgi:hypothetical protein
MSHKENTRIERQHLRRALKIAEAERVEWREKHPGDYNGLKDREKAIANLAHQLKAVGGDLLDLDLTG